MKYKLLKKIRGAEAGVIFNYNKNEIWEWVSLIEWENLWNILDLIKALWIDNKEYFEEIKDKPKTLKDLKKWDIVYFINLFWVIDTTNYQSTHINSEIFLTYKEAKKELKFRKCKRTIESWQKENDDWVIDWEDEEKYKYYILYDYKNRKLRFEEEWYSDRSALFYFSSEEIVKKAMKELEKEFIYILKEYYE